MNNMKKTYSNRVSKAIKAQMFSFIVSVVSMFIVSGVKLFAAEQIRAVTNAVVSGDSVDLGRMSLLVLLLACAGTGFIFLSSVSLRRFGLYSIRSVKDRLAEKICRLSFYYFDKKGSGSMLTKITEDTGELQSLLEGSLPGLCRSGVLFVCYFVYLAFINYKLTLASLVIFPVVMFVAKRVSNALAVLSRQRLKGIDGFAGTVNDITGDLYLEKSYCLEDENNRRVKASVMAALLPDLKRQKLGAASSAIFHISEWLPLLSCCAYGAYVAFRGEMDIGSLVVFVLLLRELTGPISELPYILTDIRQQLESIRRLNEMFDMDEETGGDVTSSMDCGEVFRFEKLSFAYDEVPVLRDISFEITKGRKAAVVGASGCGKSTVFKMLCGLYHQNSGEYRFMGIPFGDWDLEAARRNIALVSQDVFLFPDTIGSNIALGKSGANQTEIENAAKAAGIHDFIAGLPDGYETQVGERGVRLSGGERQRVSIARAFLKNAPVLLLDEPTSALDSASEAHILETLDSLGQGRTVVTIAHRLSTIINADIIYVMENGGIAEAGSHDELIRQNGVYARLYATQQAMEGEENKHG